MNETVRLELECWLLWTVYFFLLLAFRGGIYRHLLTCLLVVGVVHLGHCVAQKYNACDAVDSSVIFREVTEIHDHGQRGNVIGYSCRAPRFAVPGSSPIIVHNLYGACVAARIGVAALIFYW